MRRLFSLKQLAMVMATGTALAAVLSAGIYLFIKPSLPSIEALKDVRLQVPLRIFTKDGKLIAEFGEKRRAPVKVEEVPDMLIKAILAAEDERFYKHPGVDYRGILRAVYQLLKTGQKAQGGSTITMQVARNFFLSREKTYLRKISEIMLSFKIENALTKNEILELYLNKIYLGNRSYGVSSAAQTYYGKKIDQLNLAQLAMIAGLPKAPSSYNPIINPKRALIRRDYVLKRMRKIKFIDDSTFQIAIDEPATATLHGLSLDVKAPYIAEMARAEAVGQLGTDAYNTGYRVITTIDSRLQKAANKALRKALVEYDDRHGYRGPGKHAAISTDQVLDEWNEALHGSYQIGDLLPALVVAVENKTVVAFLPNNRLIPIYWSELVWAKHLVNVNQTRGNVSKADEILKVGDIIRVRQLSNSIWKLSQLPEVEGALVSLSPKDGAINALVGGFDFVRSKFNRAIQADRQPGSNFKPFIYSAALENGYTTATLINDAPVVFSDPGLEDTWRPENYSGKFFGPTRLREGLVNSRNLISIRLLRSIGIGKAIRHAAKFGFNTKKLPRDLSLALGSGSITPIALATGYATFANGGYSVSPYLVKEIIGPDDDVISHNQSPTVCEICLQHIAYMKQLSNDNTTLAGLSADAILNMEIDMGPLPFSIPDKVADRKISPQNVYLMTSIMRDVIKRGTGRKALRLGRSDLAGKTGTTNDQRDAWFSGFNSDIVTTVWVGYDQSHPLGDRETGGRAALPMWITFMQEALKNIPNRDLVQPSDMVTVRIDPKTGLLSDVNSRNAIFETFRAEFVPKQISDTEAVHELVINTDSEPTLAVGAAKSDEDQPSPEQLF